MSWSLDEQEIGRVLEGGRKVRRAVMAASSEEQEGILLEGLELFRAYGLVAASLLFNHVNIYQDRCHLEEVERGIANNYGRLKPLFLKSPPSHHHWSKIKSVPEVIKLDLESAGDSPWGFLQERFIKTGFLDKQDLGIGDLMREDVHLLAPMSSGAMIVVAVEAICERMGIKSFRAAIGAVGEGYRQVVLPRQLGEASTVVVVDIAVGQQVEKIYAKVREKFPGRGLFKAEH